MTAHDDESGSPSPEDSDGNDRIVQIALLVQTACAGYAVLSLMVGFIPPPHDRISAGLTLLLIYSMAALTSTSCSSAESRPVAIALVFVIPGAAVTIAVMAVIFGGIAFG